MLMRAFDFSFFYYGSRYVLAALLITAPALWAAQKSFVSSYDQHEKEKEQLFKEEQKQIASLMGLMQNYKKLAPEQSLKLAELFLKQFPNSQAADSACLIASQSCLALKHDEQALHFLSFIENKSLQKKVIAERLQLLHKFKRYEEARALEPLIDHTVLDPMKYAYCQYYLAEALHLPLKDLADPLSKADESYLKKAFTLYSSCQKEVGYLASLAMAQIEAQLNQPQQAAEQYLLASELKEADSWMCLYQAAVLLAKDKKSQALDLAWKISQSENHWQQAACMLWLKLSVELNQGHKIVNQKQILQKAYDFNELEALNLHALAFEQCKQWPESAALLKELVMKSLSQNHAQLAQLAFASLLDKLAYVKNSYDIAQVLKLYGQKQARDALYYQGMYQLAKMQHDQKSFESALESYSTIVTQNPEFQAIADCLLQKGLLESQLGLEVKSWSTLNLYLRKHADRAGRLVAWPTYLNLSLDLYDHPASLSLNEQRFERTLDHLTKAPVSLEQKQAWIEAAAERLAKKNELRAFRLLSLIQSRSSELISSTSSLLMAIFDVHLHAHIHQFCLQAQKIIDQASLPRKTSLQKLYFDELFQLAKQENSFDLQHQAADVLWQIFQADPKFIAHEPLLWFIEWQESLIHANQAAKPWKLYFQDDIYDQASTSFKKIKLDDQSRLAAVEALAALNYYIKESGLNSAWPDLMLRSARLSWLLSDFPQAIDKLVALISQNSVDTQKNKDQQVQPLAYLTGAYQLQGDYRSCYEIAQKLVSAMRQYQTSDSSWQNMQLFAARQALIVYEQNLSENKRYLSLAQGLLDALDTANERHYEGFVMEVAIERALARSKEAGANEVSLLQELKAVKVKYYESDEVHAALKDFGPALVSQRSAYGLLLDAMIAEQELKLSECSPLEYSMKHELSQNLYRTLNEPQYNTMPFILRIAAKGLESLKSSPSSK